MVVLLGAIQICSLLDTDSYVRFERIFKTFLPNGRNCRLAKEMKSGRRMQMAQAVFRCGYKFRRRTYLQEKLVDR